MYVETLFFSAVSALSLSHIARYAPLLQDENISKTTTFLYYTLILLTYLSDYLMGLYTICGRRAYDVCAGTQALQTAVL